jgi:alkylation response protein AidB-like acyl-CoA dehydrogenase
VGLGDAPFVLGAEGADVLLLARDGELHAVPKSQVALEPQPSVDGARKLARVTWTRTPASRVATGEACRTALLEAEGRGALGAAAELLGLARRMIDMTVEYAKVRKQFGAAIGSFQAVKHHLSSALVKLELARPIVYRAAHSVDQGDPARALHVSMAKASASDAATLAARTALQCHGAIGYSFEHDLHLWMKRAWALAAAWGDAAQHRARVATAIVEGDQRP